MKVRCICGAEVELDDEVSTAKTLCVQCGRVFSALNTEALRQMHPPPPPHLPPYQWLGLPVEDGPPDFYALLGVPVWEERPWALKRALRRRQRELAPLAENPDTKAGAAELLLELERAFATLVDPSRRENYVHRERARRAKILTTRVDGALRAGPLDATAVKQLCRFAEEMGLRRWRCIQYLQSRGVAISHPAPSSHRLTKVIAFAIILAALGVLAWFLWQSGLIAKFFAPP